MDANKTWGVGAHVYPSGILDLMGERSKQTHSPNTVHDRQVHTGTTATRQVAPGTADQTRN